MIASSNARSQSFTTSCSHAFMNAPRLRCSRKGRSAVPRPPPGLMRPAATEAKAEPPSLIDAIDFTNVLEAQIKLVLHAVERHASGYYTPEDDSFEVVLHGLEGVSQYLKDLQEELNEVHDATRPPEKQEKLNKAREAARA
jgi:hypothetical protein